MTTRDNAGHTTTTTYDSAGNSVSIQDANGHITHYEYGAFNRLTAVVSPKNERTEYTNRLTGELAQVKDALGNVSNFEYDTLGRMVKKTDALGMMTLRSYDNNGNATQEIDPNGNIKKYSYNTDNKLISKTLPDNIVSLIYDSRKNLLEAKDTVSQVNFAYDVGGRLVSAQSQGLGAVAALPNVTLAFGRDANGNRTSLTDPVKQSTYSFDALDRITGISVVGGSIQNYGFSYDNGGRLTSISRPGSTTAFAFDNASFLQSMIHSSGGAPLASYTLARDAIGNITQVSTNSMTKLIGYDAMNQVTSATNPEAIGSKSSEIFSYDSIYNRKTDQDGSYNYEPKSQRLVSDYRYFYFYDNNGNLRSKQAIGLTGEVTNYFYSSENQLTGFKVYEPASHDPSQLWTPSSTAVKEVGYTYDVLGRRIQKVVLDHTAAGDPTKTLNRRYVYDGQEVLLEYNGSNQLVARHTHSSLGTDDILATEVTAQGVTDKVAVNPGVYNYLKDSLGSIVDVADAAGNRLQHYVYSAFGLLLGIQDAVAADITPNPALSPYYSFAGRELDTESGLYYNRARYMDASIGRFLQKDPFPGKLGIPISVINSYSYTSNNPMNLVDPSGRSVFGVFVSVFSLGTVGLAIASGVVGALSNYNSFKNVDAPGWKKVLSASIGGLISFGVTSLSALASLPTDGLASIPIAGVGGLLNNFSNQLIFHGPSDIDFGRVLNAGIAASVAQGSAEAVGAILAGPVGTIAANVVAGYNATCVDSGISSNSEPVRPSNVVCAGVTLSF